MVRDIVVIIATTWEVICGKNGKYGRNVGQWGENKAIGKIPINSDNDSDFLPKSN